jgi:hypothetical protein
MFNFRPYIPWLRFYAEPAEDDLPGFHFNPETPPGVQAHTFSLATPADTPGAHSQAPANGDVGGAVGLRVGGGDPFDPFNGQGTASTGSDGGLRTPNPMSALFPSTAKPPSFGLGLEYFGGQVQRDTFVPGLGVQPPYDPPGFRVWPPGFRMATGGLDPNTLPEEGGLRSFRYTPDGGDSPTLGFPAGDAIPRGNSQVYSVAPPLYDPVYFPEPLPDRIQQALDEIARIYGLRRFRPTSLVNRPTTSIPSKLDNDETGDDTMSRAWPLARNDGWPHVQLARLHDPWSTDVTRQPIGVPPIQAAAPIEGSNFILPNAPSAAGSQAERQMSLQQYRPTQSSSSLDTAARSSDGPSLGQRLVQSSVETIVPGAHYQRLARQQLGSGNYVGAGVYQAAALLDAVLGAATLGLSTRLGAAGRAAAAEGAALFRRAFDSGSQLLRYLGPAPKGMQWHHIVEQSQAAQFSQRAIQSVENVVAIPTEAHQRLSAFYSSKQYFSEPNTVREWLRGQSFEAQYAFGMEQLKRVLGY